MKTLKKPLSIVLSIAMVFCMVACLPLTVGAVGGAFTVTSDAEANTVKDGDSFNVTIKLDGTGIPTNSLKFTVTYDPAVFELNESTAIFDSNFALAVGATESGSFNPSTENATSLKDVTVDAESGKVTFTVINISAQLADEQTVAVLGFKAISASESSDITVTPAAGGFVSIADSVATEITTAYKDAASVAMTVESSGLLGDTNGDGYVTAADATILFNFARQNGKNYGVLTAENATSKADTNGDGYVTAADATILFNFARQNGKNYGVLA